MPRDDSFRKKLLDATLKTLLASLDIPAWLKAPATFVAELSARFRDLPARELATIGDATDEQIADALFQLDLATKHAATASAGVSRIEDQIAALRAAIRDAATPNIIEFPGPHVTQNVTGDGNIVGGGPVTIGNVDMRHTSRRARTPILPGTVATDPYKVGYLQYLADRFNEFKEWEVGKEAMNYALIRVSYKREMKFPISHTPLDRFDAAIAYLQSRIRSSKVGRIRARQGDRLFDSFAEFAAYRQKA